MGGPVESTQYGRPTEQRAPVEGKSEHGLRPMTESFDEGIERHDRHHAEAEPDGGAVEAEQHGEPDQAQHHHEYKGGARCHLSAGQRAAAGSCHLCIEVAVDQVIIGAASAAHDQRAQREQEQEPWIGIGLADASRRQRHRPEAGQGQQEEAGRPVGAGEPEIRHKRGRSEAIDPIAGARVGHGACFTLGQGSCHVVSLQVLGPSLAFAHVLQAPAPIRQVKA